MAMLTIEQKNSLLLELNGTKDYKMKTRISAILLRDKGLTYQQIAEELGTTDKIPWRWINRWKQCPKIDSLKDVSCTKNRKPRKLSPEGKDFLIKKSLEVLEDKGSESKTWLLRELAEELETEMGIKLSLFHIYKTLKNSGISLDRNKQKNKTYDCK